MSTAGPTPGLSASPWATRPASEKIPTPMMPPTPIAVSCQSPRLLVSTPAPLSFSTSSMRSTGIRRQIDPCVDTMVSLLPSASRVRRRPPRPVPDLSRVLAFRPAVHLNGGREQLGQPDRRGAGQGLARGSHHDQLPPGARAVGGPPDVD